MSRRPIFWTDSQRFTGVGKAHRHSEAGEAIAAQIQHCYTFQRRGQFVWLLAASPRMPKGVRTQTSGQSPENIGQPARCGDSGLRHGIDLAVCLSSRVVGELSR